ncbi:MAG: glycosyltransferase [Candidatus Eisenbacteria bacterium]|nr:glycosyltransferase [Candidatus Eisenbacteria bacterium]
MHPATAETPAPTLSVVIFSSRNEARPLEVLAELRRWLAGRALDHEVVLAFDADRAGLAHGVRGNLESLDRTRLVVLSASQGQLATIRAGVAVSTGRYVVTLPAFPQVDPSAVGVVLEALERGADYVVGCRAARRISWFNRLVSGVFNAMVHAATGTTYRDIACGAHGMRREVLAAIPSYGDNQLFLPILAAREGFTVVEASLPEHKTAPKLRVFSPGTYLGRALSLFTLAFLVRFTQKPLRPFGALGAVLFGAGSLTALVLLVQRLFMHRGLADRPLLLLALLLVTAGVQVIILGLLGELLIYLHFRDQVQYRVRDRIDIEGGMS